MKLSPDGLLIEQFLDEFEEYWQVLTEFGFTGRRDRDQSGRQCRWGGALDLTHILVHGGVASDGDEEFVEISPDL